MTDPDFEREALTGDIGPPKQGEPGHSITDVAQRRIRALTMRNAGYTYQQIADELGYADPSSTRDLIMRSLRAIEGEKVVEMRALDNMRIDQALQAIWPRVLRGDDNAITSLMRLLKRRADLNGLDAPKQVQVSAGVMAEMEQAFGELRLVVMGEVVPDGPDEMDALEG